MILPYWVSNLLTFRNLFLLVATLGFAASGVFGYVKNNEVEEMKKSALAQDIVLSLEQQKVQNLTDKLALLNDVVKSNAAVERQLREDNKRWEVKYARLKQENQDIMDWAARAYPDSLVPNELLVTPTGD